MFENMLIDIKNSSFIRNINGSPLVAGIMMILLNVASKYISIELSHTQEEYLKNTLGRQILIFAISFTATKDVILSFVLTAVFYVLTMHLFNENSSLCIVPKEYRRYKNILDLDGDGVVTEEEIRKANKYNPEGAAERGLWSDQDFLRGVSEMNPTLKNTQFADYHGHGWNFRAIFKKDRKGYLLDEDDNIVDHDDPEKFDKAVHMSSIHEKTSYIFVFNPTIII